MFHTLYYIIYVRYQMDHIMKEFKSRITVGMPTTCSLSEYEQGNQSVEFAHCCPPYLPSPFAQWQEKLSGTLGWSHKEEKRSGGNKSCLQQKWKMFPEKVRITLAVEAAERRAHWSWATQLWFAGITTSGCMWMIPSTWHSVLLLRHWFQVLHCKMLTKRTKSPFPLLQSCSHREENIKK